MVKYMQILEQFQPIRDHVVMQLLRLVK